MSKVDNLREQVKKLQSTATLQSKKIKGIIDRVNEWKAAMIDDSLSNILRQLSKKSINVRAKHIIIKNIDRIVKGGIPGWGFLIPRKKYPHDLSGQVFDLLYEIEKKREYCKSRNIRLK